MVEIVKRACAGTMESSDAYVEIEPAQGMTIELESAVADRFGSSIRAAAEQVLAQCGVENASLRIIDQGALDCVIRARIETAVRRGSEVEE